MSDHDIVTPPRRYARVADAAEYVGVSEKTIRRLIDSGRLTTYRLGPRIVRVDLGQVDRLMSGARS